MMRAYSWLRAVIPVAWVLAVGVLPQLLFGAVYFFYRSAMSGAAAQDVLVPRDSALIAGGVAYGIYRVAAFHPFLKTDYRDWLSITPWTVERPLPLGPIHLVAQDVLLGIFFVALYHHPMLPRFMPVMALLLGYLVVLAIVFVLTEEKFYGYLILFGLGLAVHFELDSVAALVVASGLYLVSLRGLRTSLAQFPWPIKVDWDSLNQGRAKQLAISRGWPHHQLLECSPSWLPSRGERAVWCTLAGWWFFVITTWLWNDTPAGGDVAEVIYWAVVIPVALVRTFSYCSNYWPPISLLGRLRTMRWIIPGYDRVYVAPLVTLAVGALLPWLLGALGTPQNVAASVSMTAAIFLALNLPPSLLQWRTTGEHRIVPDRRYANEFVRR